MDIFTVGVVTKPFENEREYKMNRAIKGIDEMRRRVAPLFIIPNEGLLRINGKEALSFEQLFAMSDDAVYRSVKIIFDEIYDGTTGSVGTAFADFCSILGDARIAWGTGTGENKIQDAVSQVVNSPLLENSFNSASKLMINITLAEDSGMEDLHDAISLISNAADPSVDLMQSIFQDDSLTDTISITVIAAGFKDSSAAVRDTSFADLGKSYDLSSLQEIFGNR